MLQNCICSRTYKSITNSLLWGRMGPLPSFVSRTALFLLKCCFYPKTICTILKVYNIAPKLNYHNSISKLIVLQELNTNHYTRSAKREQIVSYLLPYSKYIMLQGIVSQARTQKVILMYSVFCINYVHTILSCL